MRDELAGSDVPLTRSKARRYTGEANKLHREGVDPLEIYEAADRVISEWERVRLSLDDALRDLRNGRQANGGSPTKPDGTPPEIVEYIFENSRSDMFRASEARFRRIFARFDFSTGESPPFPVLAEMGGTDNERWQALDAIQALVRRAKREAA